MRRECVHRAMSNTDSGVIVVGGTARRLSVTARRLLVGALVLFAAGLDYHMIVKGQNRRPSTLPIAVT